MKPIATLFVTVLLVFTSSCGFFRKDRPTAEGEAMTESTSLTVTEAARIVSGYVSMIVGKPIDPNPAYAGKIGCRTNAGLMSDGPPWQVRRDAWITDPAPELVEGALTRIDTLADEGFERVPWSRPDPEPPNYKRYRDSRGYFVLARAEVNSSGTYALEVSATSPCANDD